MVLCVPSSHSQVVRLFDIPAQGCLKGWKQKQLEDKFFRSFLKALTGQADFARWLEVEGKVGRPGGWSDSPRQEGKEAVGSTTGRCLCPREVARPQRQVSIATPLKTPGLHSVWEPPGHAPS